MKKFLFTILSFLSFVQIVDAEVFYSEYSAPILQEEKVAENDVTKVEEEKRYLYYNETKILGDYYIEGENEEEYPYIDKNDFKESEFSNWTKLSIADKKNRYVESRLVRFYKVPEKIRYIHFYNLSGNYYNFRIPELQIYYDGVKIDYDYYCEGCNENFDVFVRNGNTKENMSHVENGGYLRIDLKDDYDPTKLTIDLYLYDVEATTKTYTIDLTQTTSYGENSFYRKTFNETFKHSSIQDVQLFRYTISDLGRVNPIMFDYYAYDDEESLYDSKYLIEQYTQRRYKDIYYRYYNFERNYSDEYLSSATETFPIKDETQYKLYYFVSTREKVELTEPLIINQKNQTLEDLIKVNTTNEVQISWNGKYTHNDTYEVTYTFPFQTITRTVNVSIPENDENETEIARLKEQIKLYEQKIEELEKTNENNLSTLNELQKQIEMLQQDLKQEQENYKILEQTKLNFEKELDLKKQDLDSLRKEFDEKVKIQSGLQQELEQKEKLYENELETHQEELKILENQIKKIEEEKKKIEKEIATKEKSKEELILQMETLNQELHKEKEQYNELEKMNQTLNEQIKTLVKEQEEKVINLENQKITYQESIRILQDQMELQNNHFSVLQETQEQELIESKKALELLETKLEQQEALTEEYKTEELLKNEEINLLKEKVVSLNKEQTCKTNNNFSIYLILTTSFIAILCIFYFLKSRKSRKIVG